MCNLLNFKFQKWFWWNFNINGEDIIAIVVAIIINIICNYLIVLNYQRYWISVICFNCEFFFYVSWIFNFQDQWIFRMPATAQAFNRILDDLARRQLLLDFQFGAAGSSYEAIRNIGSGAFGIVCEAVETNSGTKVGWYLEFFQLFFLI